MKRFLSMLLVAILIFSLAACTSGDSDTNTETPAQTYSLKLGHVLAATTPEAEIWQWFADEVKSRTEGAVDITVYPNEELGSAAVQVESLKVGTIDMFVQGTTVFAGPTGIATFNLSSTPFLFGDQELYMKAMSGSGMNDEQAAAAEAVGLHIVNTARNFFRGPRVLISRNPIQSLDDMNGLRFRAYESDSYVGAYTALGAAPLIVAWSETYSALQNGTVDAAGSSIDQIISAKLCEVVKNVTWTYEYNTDVVCMANKDSWDKIPTEYQDIITTVANEAGDKMKESVAANVDGMIEQLKNEYGCTFYEVDLAAWRVKLEDFYQKLVENGTIPESVLEYVL